MIRIYGLAGCPKCQQALAFCLERGLPVQYIDYVNDPVIKNGILALKHSQGLPMEATFPVLVSFASMEVVDGWKPEEYEAVYQRYLRVRHSGGAPNAAAADGKPAGNPTGEAQPEKPAPANAA